MKRIGLLTSGGDCQALNPTMRGLYLALKKALSAFEIYGFEDGFNGLILGNFRRMTRDDFTGILNRGGTILGTSRFSFRELSKEGGDVRIEAMKRNYRSLQLDCLVILGGNGTQKTANLLREEGLNIIHLPKTIDNDIFGTEETFGFQSAVDVATECIDRLRSTAISHSRVFLVELMGHKAGYLTLHAGIAAGADLILIPEIPYNLEKVCQGIKSYKESGLPSVIVAVAEGAYPDTFEDRKKSEREYPINDLAAEIESRTGYEVRVSIPGHLQRGGEPSAYDRVLATQIGAFGAQMILDDAYGYMAGVRSGELFRVPLQDCAGKKKALAKDDQLIMLAKSIGILFGD